MSSDFQNRLYEMEVMPPSQVWERLSANLDEINADNNFAKKIYNTEIKEVHDSWQAIKAKLYPEENFIPQKKGMIINFKRVAVAAVSIGIIISVWLLFFNTQQKKSDLAEAITSPVKEQKNCFEKSEPSQKTSAIEQEKKKLTVQSIALNRKIPNKKQGNMIRTSFVKTRDEIEPAITTDNTHLAKLNDKPGEKIFDQPIDDLSMIAVSDDYVTMVNANGRMVKIPAHLAYLAPRLQDKPLTEDYHEIMFGEGAFWNEKLNDWRQKLATSPVASGDIFSNMIDLLKNLQGK